VVDLFVSRLNRVEITPLTKFVGMFLTESAQIGDLCVIKVA